MSWGPSDLGRHDPHSFDLLTYIFYGCFTGTGIHMISPCVWNANLMVHLMIINIRFHTQELFLPDHVSKSSYILQMGDSSVVLCHPGCNVGSSLIVFM